jgi:sugar phosphate isomerase/epimerase
MSITRRHFLAGVGAAAAASSLRPLAGAAFARRLAAAPGPFKVSVLTDEISQDFAHACEVAAKEFGLGYVELRAMHNKNVMNWDDKDVANARAILEKFGLQVSEIASPIFKADWPGAPKSKFSPKQPEFGADFTEKQQDDLIDRACELAKTFKTPHVRIFDFWRLEDQAPYRAAIDERVRKAAVRAASKGITLTLENEPSCNTATGAEAARLLKAVNEPGLMLNWDPGNAASRGEVAYPDGYAGLPKNRIGHVHCKDVVKKDGGGTAWAPMGKGIIDWAGQFKALAKDGYRGAVSLETHWHGGGTPEESSRQSFAGMKQLLAQVGS